MADWNQVERHFDQADAAMLRGENHLSADLRYAAYILQVCSPKSGAEILDVGCGDGVVCRAIKQLRPDLSISGVDISSVLIEKAQAAGEGIAYQVANVVEQEFFLSARFDLIFSFSFARYLDADELTKLNRTLLSKLHLGGKVCHLSIPDRRKWLLYCVCNQLNQGRSQARAWAMGVAITLAKLRDPKMSDGISRWHRAARLLAALPPDVRARINRPSDSWYRFDLIAESSESTHE